MINEEISKKVAKILVSIPGLLERGPTIIDRKIKSPLETLCIENIYTFPKKMKLIAKLSKELIRGVNFDFVVGCETVGIPFAVYFSEVNKYPFSFIRKKGFVSHSIKKKNKKIFGTIDKKYHKRCLLIDDTIFNGTNIEFFINTLISEKIKINAILTIVDMREIALNWFSTPIPIYSLTSYSSIIDAAVDINLLTKKEGKLIKEWIIEKWDASSPKWNELEWLFKNR
jgi:orotate phosphoribosyltransferase